MMNFKFHKLQITRRFVQIFVLALLLAIPTVARYNNYLAARELDKRIEKWNGTLRGETLSALDRVFRLLPGGEKERAGRTVRNRKQVLLYAQQLRGGVLKALGFML